ncbi:DUF402 domain-containing protein [Dermacoccaceae bacterium W4C1]
MQPSPGDPVHVDFRKWDDSPHWQHTATYLGADSHGRWVGVPAGTHLERPGAAFDMDCASVMLFPNQGYVAAFNDEAATRPSARIYVDLSTRPQWFKEASGWRVNMIDLDLDVIARRSGETFLDDEDEWADHQQQYGYPAAVIASTEALAARLMTQVAERTDAFDPQVEGVWFERWKELS